MSVKAPLQIRLLHSLVRFRHSLIVFAHDALMIPVAWFAAYWLRFNLGMIPDNIFSQAITVLPAVVLVQIVLYWHFGLYRGVWRFASMPDLLRIVKAAASSVLLISLFLFLYNRLQDIPRSVLPLYGMLLVMLLGGSRFIFRWWKDYGQLKLGKRVLIIGAGVAGESLVRDLKRKANSDYWPVGIVDDDARHAGKEIHGVRVLGKTRDIPNLVARYNIDLVIIALPSVKSGTMRRIVSLCDEANVTYRTLPSLNDLADGRVSVEALRQVSLEDLLGRDPVQLDWTHITESIKQKVILVTGGAGSIGSELCRQIARLNPALLIVADQNESELYHLRITLEKQYPQLTFSRYLLDVTDQKAVDQLMKTYRPDMVFHAAAYKHVPMLETQARIAVRNNIFGTQVVANAANAAGVKKFVLISTDKAVHPANVMGATKRAAEILCQNFNAHSETEFITVRFGNVLGSAGSVVPLFREQIATGGPVTVTHPEITRFFMTIPEATQLILQATVLGQGGEIFVLDMGESVKIADLAKQMIKLAGLIPDEDIPIEYIGLRPGEKLYEELFHESEHIRPTVHRKILQAQYRERDWDQLLQMLQTLRLGIEQIDDDAILSGLAKLVPEWQRKETPPSLISL